METNYSDNDLAEISLILFRNGRVVRRIVCDGKPIKLDKKTNGRFDKIRIELLTCSAMIRSGLPIDSEKVKTFLNYSKLNFDFVINGELEKDWRESKWLIDDDDYDDEYDEEWEGYYDLGVRSG